MQFDELIAQHSLQWTTARGILVEFTPYGRVPRHATDHARLRLCPPVNATPTTSATRLPSSTVEPGERWQATLLRQLLEETGGAISHSTPFAPIAKLQTIRRPTASYRWPMSKRYKPPPIPMDREALSKSANCHQ